MSDMEVIEIIGSSESLPEEVNDNIVFEPPSKREMQKLAGEASNPVVDQHGRPRWIAKRLCWCHDSAETDCRFHPETEKGWEECPADPKFNKQGAQMKRALKPRSLWATNPDFGKPLPKEEAANDEAQAESEVAA